ncbi:MAG: hypothetical protein VKJ64_13755 [Leptolyngbyaceae bacterium]|nr:hypothetical protein [Leptolyngbyaceae bacterium]
MNLQLSDHTFAIVLEGWEQLWAAHLGQTIYVPIDHIVQVTVGLPQGIWDGIRAPGTFVPGVIRAGTYYTQQGREFWYVTRQDDTGFDQTTVLALNLTADEYYKRIVLSASDCQGWGDRLQAAILAK